MPWPCNRYGLCVADGCGFCAAGAAGDGAVAGAEDDAVGGAAAGVTRTARLLTHSAA